jgi:hypothetical protein
MSFFMVVFKVIPYLVPFLKEMMLGKKTWRQAFKDNRGKTILMFAVMVSVIFNVVLTARVGTLAYRYLELSRAKEELDAKYHALEKPKLVVEGTPRHPMANSQEISTEVRKEPKLVLPTKHVVTVVQDTKLAAELQADLDRIRTREATEF